MKNINNFLLSLFIVALLVLFQAMIYACVYSFGISIFATEFGYQLPTISFELFILLEAIRQLLIRKTKDTVEVGSTEFFKRFWSHIITKLFWLIVCLIIYLCYGK